MLVHRVVNWLTFKDYDIAKANATKAVVRRFSRGNISLKNGLFLDKRALDRLSIEADKATARLSKAIHS